MKKYLIPEMDIELFEGEDLFSPSTIPSLGCENGDCTEDTECKEDSCGNDLDFDPGCPAVWGGPGIFD